MGSPSELSLDYKPSGYTAAPKPFGDQPEQSQKLEEFLARLEEERLKIEAFKRELPLCMQLLNNAMEAYWQQLETYHTNQGPRPVLEEFIPLKHASNATDGSEKSPAAAKASCEKASWMTSVQLWSPAEGGCVKLTTAPLKDADHGVDVNPKLVLDNKSRSGGAFLPFTRDRSGRGRGVLPDLALAPVEKMEEKKCSDVEMMRRSESCGKGAAGAEAGKAAASAANPTAECGQAAAAAQSQRKARRCWSPDLHRRFVNALQMLGGSQVATPKQIRELMKVDGLTNDEVKSHLQKYRLHTRRPIPAPPAAASAAAPQLVVLGGIWVPQEYATTAAAAAAVAAAPGIYAAHPSPAHYCAAPVPQDFYSPPPQATHHQQLPPHQHRGTAAASAAHKAKHDSAEPDVRGSRNNSDSIEDGEEEEEEEAEDGEEEDGDRSESSSWKGGDEKALVPVREGGKVSNGGDVVLKF